MTLATINDPMEDAQTQDEQQEQAQGSVPEFGGGSGVADARASTGAPVGQSRQQTKPTSSGSFQDFSKFQAANKTKVGELGTQVAQDAATARTEGRKGIDTAVQGARTNIAGQQQDASKLGNITAANLADKQQDIKQFRDFRMDQDAVQRAALDNVGKAYSDYQKGVGGFQQAKDLTGVKKLFQEHGPDRSNVAAAGDALLFRSNVDARNKLAQQQAETAKFDAAKAQQQNVDALGQQISDVAKANELARGQVDTQLGTVQDNILRDIASREKSVENRLYQEAINAALEKARGLGSGFTDRSQIDVESDWSANQNLGNLSSGTQPVVSPAEYRGDIYSSLSQSELEKALGGQDALRQAFGIDNLVSGSNIVSSDPKLQATLNALAGLGQAGYDYQDAGTVDTLTGTGAGAAGFDSLKSQLADYVNKQNEARIAEGKTQTQNELKAIADRENALRSTQPVSNDPLMPLGGGLGQFA